MIASGLAEAPHRRTSRWSTPFSAPTQADHLALFSAELTPTTSTKKTQQLPLRYTNDVIMDARNDEIGVLLGEQAKMAGDTNPFAIFLYPRVGETASVFVVLAFGSSLLVRCTGDND